MRPRFNRIAMCSHTTPDGKSQMSREEILRKKFDSCNITEPELREYASFIAISGRRQPSFKEVTILGVTKRVTKEQYERYYKPCGL